ncbi:hypothetical protein PG988_006862 [Apiospora saccharicola]
MIAPLVDLPVRRLFRSLSLSVPWRGDGSGTDTATIANGTGAKSDSTHDNFAAAVELQTWPIPPSSASSISSSTTTTRTASPRAITTLVEDPESFSSQDQAQLTRERLHSAARQVREKYPHHQLPQIRPRASRGSFDSSRSRSSTISTLSSSRDDLTAFRRPQERQRACEDCWKEFWG